MAERKTKKEFMERLQRHLAHLPEDQIADILYDYEEHFQIGAETRTGDRADHSIMTNEDFVICYPRRIEKGYDYEVWQYPYVRDGVFYDNFDVAVVRFGGKSNTVTLVTEHEDRLHDTDYIARIQLLIHDISEDFFEVKVKLVKNIFSEETDAVIDRLKREAIS